MAGDPRDVLGLLRPWVRDGGEPLVVRTSGSTGRPKDVVLSHAALVASAAAAHERLGGPGQWLLDLPVDGVAGLQVLVRSVLAGTVPVLAAEHADLASAVAAMTGERRYASLVPTQLHRLDAAGRLDVLAGLDALLVGGAAADPALLARARDAGVTVVRTYGMTETCGGCVYDGLPLRDVRVRVDDGGQVLLAGPVLFDGYVGAPRQAEWFATADLGALDVDGRLSVLGRVDDVVQSGGVNVALPAVERAVASLPGVRAAAVVAAADAEWGTRVVAFVVPDGTVDPDALRLDELRDGVQASGLPRTWAPRQVVLLEELPLLPGGKIDLVGLRARL